MGLKANHLGVSSTSERGTRYGTFIVNELSGTGFGHIMYQNSHEIIFFIVIITCIHVCYGQ